MDKISVVIPIYNVEKYLHRTIDAVINQTYDNLEIILVNDGSTDRSGKICDEYEKKDARIKVIHKENGGSSTARNTGIEVASGDYIGFLDSDDWAEPDMYENLIKAIKEFPGTKVAQIMSRDFDTDGNEVKPPLKNSGKNVLMTVQETITELMLHTGDSSFCTKIIEAELMKKYRFPEHELNEDYGLLIAMLPEIGNIVTAEKPGYNIELRTGSNTRGSYNQSLYECMMANAVKTYKFVRNNYPELTEYAERFWIVQLSYFMLNIPVSRMTKDNEFYMKQKAKLKTAAARRRIRTNSYLDKKVRRNMLILAYFPTRGVRRIHLNLMKLRKKGK